MFFPFQLWVVSKVCGLLWAVRDSKRYNHKRWKANLPKELYLDVAFRAKRHVANTVNHLNTDYQS